jgi:hypothetical protein
MRWYVLAALLILLVVGVVALVGWKRGAFDPAPTAILFVSPNLTVLSSSSEAFRVTGARVYQSGAEVLCMYADLPPNGSGSMSDDPSSYSNSVLRLRFEKSSLPVVMLQSGEGSPLMHELKRTDAVAEFIYRGDTQRILLRVRDGKVVIETLPP